MLLETSIAIVYHAVLYASVVVLVLKSIEHVDYCSYSL